jgi:hypothetical protein
VSLHSCCWENLISYNIKIHRKEVSYSDMHKIELARNTRGDVHSIFAVIDL